MQRNFFSSARLPKFHDAMLIVKMRPTAAPIVEAALAPALGRGIRIASTARAGVDAFAGTDVAHAPMSIRAEALGISGMNVLAQYDRGGMIRRITSLAPRSTQPLETEILSARHGTIASTGASRSTFRSNSRAAVANAGVNLVELERDEDTVQLQKALATDPLVEFVSRVPIRYLLAKPAAKRRVKKAAPPSAAMWNLAKIDWAKARALAGFKDATNVNVAVLDSGIDDGHPDLAGRIASYTFLHPDTASISGQKDIIGHGTHVAGTIGALINNQVGINGICRARLNIWKIFPDQTEFAGEEGGFAYFVDPVMYRRALADCIDQGIDIINLSIGGPGEPDPQEAQLFAELLASGTTIVAAMGNERREGSPTSYPAAIPGVIAVGATGITDKVTQFSSRGDHISVCAPGKGIWSTLPTYAGQFGFEAVRGPNGRFVEGKRLDRETDYDDWDGTSMASPHVAAALALLIAKVGKRGPAELRKELIARCDPVPEMQGRPFDSDYGYGRLNLARLLN